MPYFSANMHQI